jgi:hypothetical protein
LKAEKKNSAIWSASTWGPEFGDSCDIFISDHCNTNTYSGSSFGSSYFNDTGLDGCTFFTGSEHFKVKEIEVFEITD